MQVRLVVPLHLMRTTRDVRGQCFVYFSIPGGVSTPKLRKVHHMADLRQSACLGHRLLFSGHLRVEYLRSSALR